MTLLSLALLVVAPVALGPWEALCPPRGGTA